MRLIRNVSVGQVFGMLTVLAYDGKDAFGCIMYKVVCECGKVFSTRKNNLTNLKRPVQSCGCVRMSKLVNQNLTHGMTDTAEYKAFRNAKMRCENKKHKAYKHYGGRGIRFCFETFEQWYAELGPRPSPKHSVDRIDNNGNYEPGNLRWATQSDQLRNRRSTKKAA